MTEDTIASPEPPRPDRTRIALAALGGGLSVLLIGAGALAVSGMASADTGATPTPTAGTADQAAPGAGRWADDRGPGMMGGMLGGLGAMGHLGDALHGSAVLEEDDGDFVTYEAQRGTVTAVSATSVSVRSKDGYEHTYAVDDSTIVNLDGSISDIAKGTDVAVVATQDAGASTATRIIDLSGLQQRLDEMRKRFEDQAGGMRLPGVPWHRGAPHAGPSAGDDDGSAPATPTPSKTPSSPEPAAPSPTASASATTSS